MFKDRVDAGRQLAGRLSSLNKQKDAIVLGIPRGGVVIAKEIANILNLPLDILVVKKIGCPGQEELALGAASSDDFVIMESIARMFALSPEEVSKLAKAKQNEVKEKMNTFRRDRPAISLKDKIVILTDDGVATGATMLMAIKLLKNQQPKKIVVALPVAPPDALKELKNEADEVVCLLSPEGFMAISQFYQNFDQVEDKEVIRYLEAA